MNRFYKNPGILIMLIVLPHFAGAQFLSDTIDVIHYEVNLDVLNLPAKILKGRTDVEFLVRQPSLQNIVLELKQMQVDSVKSQEGIPLEFMRSGDRLNITLATPVTPVDTTLISIWYHGVPFSESWGGFHFTSTYAFNLGVGFQSIPHNLGKAWFPCVDDFKDRALYDYHVRVAVNHKAVCGGLLQSVTANGDGTHTFHWHTNQTIPTYLASVAVGPYELVSDIFNGMEDDIPVTYYVRPADTGKVQGTFQNMNTIAAAYESRFGPYPFSRIGITGTALGAMEHSENIFYPNSSISGSPAGEWLYAHELSHMWFGDKVTCASAEDMWLNEGWARWCEILFTEMLYGEAEAEDYYKELHYSVLRNTHITDGGFRALSPMPQEYTYGSTVYDKGAVVAHSLRYYMGDSLFFNGVRSYLQQYAYNSANSYQLRDALEASSGMDLNGFFDFFVFTPGFTHYSVDSFNLILTCGNYRTVVYMKQKLRSAQTYAQDCRVDLSFMNSNREIETYQVNFSGAAGSDTVLLRWEPILVMPDIHHHLADATTDEIKTISTTGTYDFVNTFCKVNVTQVNDSAFIRVTHNWVAPDSLFVEQPGLTLSSNHYWSIEGIFPPGFSAKGNFSYNRNVLDGDIITNQNDSIVLLYRPGTYSDWLPVDFTQTGIWQLGTLTVNDLKPGQYTFAIWDEMYVGNNDIDSNHSLLHIFPNPAKDTFTIQTSWTQPSKLIIYNSAGKRVYSTKVNSHEELRWSGEPGTYIITLTAGNKRIAAAKAIIK